MSIIVLEKFNTMDYWSVGFAAEYIGVAVATVNHRIDTGQLQGYRFRTARLVKFSDIEEWKRDIDARKKKARK